LFGAGLGEM